jgi:hypothetical protein
MTALLSGAAAGLVLTAALSSEAPVLEAVRDEGGVRIDDRNVVWSARFDDPDDLVEVVCDGGHWYLPRTQCPDGFPETIRVASGAPAQGRTAYVTPQPWNDGAARRAEVAVTVAPDHSVPRHAAPTLDRFREYHDVRPGDVVTVSGLLSTDGRDGQVLARTANELVVRVETDSLTLHAMGTIPASSDIARGRMAEVVHVAGPFPARLRQDGSPVSAAELVAATRTEGAGPEEVAATVADAREIAGVLVRRVLGTDRGMARCGLWLHFADGVHDGEVHYVELTPDVFGDDFPRWIGQPVRAVRAMEGWMFRAQNRYVTTRAFFAVDDDVPAGDQDVFVGSDGTSDLHQPFDRPLLRRGTGGIGAGASAVKRLKVADAEVTPLPGRPGRVAVAPRRAVNAVLVGDGQDRIPPARAHVVGVRLVTSDVDGRDAEGRRLVRVRRTFRVAGGVVAAEPSSGDDVRARWEAFRAGGEEHVVGRLVRGDRAVELPRLHPPAPDGTPSRVLTLVEGDAALVRDAKYPGDVRVRLVPEGAGYRGSSATAEPLSISEFVAAVTTATRPDGRHRRFSRPVLYVGVRDDGPAAAHVFEWSRGRTVHIPVGQLAVAKAPENPDIPLLFHGDLVQGAAFTRRHDAIEMTLDPSDVDSLVRRVVIERQRQHVHLVEVEVDLGRAIVRVKEVRTGRRGRGQADDGLRSAEWSSLGGVLSDDAAEQLIAKVRQDDPDAAGLVTRRLLARLDPEMAIRTLGRTLLYHPVDVAARDGGLRQGDHLYLTALGFMPGTNELSVRFGLPDEAASNLLRVRVNRRDFSWRQSTLERLRARGVDFGSGDVTMLVTLTSRDDGWRGTIRKAPPRRLTTLASYVAIQGGSCLAVVGENASGLRLEIAPGVFYDVPEFLGAATGLGGIVRVSCDADGRITLTPAMPADGDYLPAGGRPAIVFPKTSLLRDNFRGNWVRSYTVGSLPGVEVTPMRGGELRLLARPHPKLVEIVPGTPNPSIREASKETRAARVGPPDVTAPATLLDQRCQGADPPQSVPWSRLSFEDGPARRVARACETRTWKHHDRYTGYRRGGDGEVRRQDLEPASACDEPVFFANDGGWTLRYPVAERAQFGLPAGALLESDWTSAWTAAVAGPSTGGGLWLEIGPGRVIEVRGALLTAPGGASLERLDWSLFAPGDLVRLSQAGGSGVDRWSTSLRELVVESWQPSVRGAFVAAASRMLLPVDRRDRDRGALRLGVGREKVTVPMDVAGLDALGGADAVWLDQCNDVTPRTEPMPAPGDTVLLGVDDAELLTVVGFPQVDVQLAPVTQLSWPGGGWLRDLLADPTRRAGFLAAIGGCLPVTVYTVGEAKVTISRAAQPSGAWPSGRAVRTEVVAAIGDTLLLRSGAALFQVSVRSAVPGLSRRDVEGTATALAARDPEPAVLWWRVDEQGRPTPGLRSGPLSGPEDLVVEAERSVERDGAAAGVVCRDRHTLQLRWLPARHASWARGLPGAALLAGLRTCGPLAVRELTDDAVSVTSHPAVTHRLGALQMSDPMRVAISAVRPRQLDDGRWQRVAALEVPKVLLTHVAVDVDAVEEGASVLAEVDGLDSTGQPSVVVVPRDSRLVVMDLPLWLLDAHHAIRGTASGRRAAIVPSRFHDYSRWFRDGRASHEAAGRPVTDLLVALGAHTRDEDVDVQPVVERWLSSESARAAFGVDGRSDVDAAVALAAVRLLHVVGRDDPEAARASVFLLRQVGLRATASLHVEPFLREWVQRTDRHTLDGAWSRLRNLPLDRELSPPAARSVREFCSGILMRPVLRGHESDLATIARSLQAALGDLESVAALDADSRIVRRLRVWAQVLQPARQYATAQRELHPAQHDVVAAFTEQLLLNGVALTLLPPARRLLDTERQFAENYLQN